MLTRTYCAVHGKDKDHEEKRKVSGAIVLREHEDETSNEHNGDRINEEPETVADSVACQGVEE